MANSYRATTYKPQLVTELKNLACKDGFTKSCDDLTGRVLRTLAGQVREGTILEIGTGYGVGSAWIMSALWESAKFITVERNEEQVDKIKQILERHNIEVIAGDWKSVLDKGPFKFVFADATNAKREECELLFSSLQVGGTVLMDDFTPEEHWPESWRGKPDPVREYWLNHTKLSAVELLLNPKVAIIMATKLED